MPTLSVRDVPDHIINAIDRAVSQSGSRSREAYIRDLVIRMYGSETSITSAIGERAMRAVSAAVDLSRDYRLEPTASVATIARALGHADTATLEATLNGTIPMTFTDGDRLCDLLGLSRPWLETGAQPHAMYAPRARHRDSLHLLADFVENGIGYRHIYCMLIEDENPDGWHTAAMIGHTSSSTDPKIGWKYELLLDRVPIHEHVGGSGSRARRDFADLLAALEDGMLPNEVTTLLGCVVPHAIWLDYLSGRLHPCAVTNFNAQHALSDGSLWPDEYIWFEDALPRPIFGAARAAMRDDFKVADKITTTAEHRATVRATVERLRRQHEPATKHR